jgi:predicted ATP-dependent endonuclease of OLD family
MIVGLLVRSFKVYSGWAYVPLSRGDYFTSIIGDNGVGKSSVLEALDIFFNKHVQSWNYNHASLKSGLDKSQPEVCPVFMVEKKKVNHRSNVYKCLEKINDILWGLEVKDYNSSHHKIINPLKLHVDKLIESGYNKEKYFLFPCGVKKVKAQTEFSMAFFESSPYWKEMTEVHDPKDQSISLNDILTEVVSYVRENIEYIYIPSEINYEQYTKIEGSTIQALMGTTVDNIIRDLIDENVLKRINKGLDDFLKEIEVHLTKYQYKKPSAYQTRFNLTHLSSKIIETYFDSKVLNLKAGPNLTPIYNCSSGEKRRAVIDLAEAFILNSERNNKEKLVVLAIDEPEVSLHMSACFDQFSKIEKISRNGIQTIISSHWYGFLPSVSAGCAVYISDVDNNRASNYIDLRRFREDIKALKESSRGTLPSNIELKTINDTVQSVISTIVYSDLKWIVCEGASDRIYLNKFFSDMEDVRIVSVGGSKYVKQFYEYLYLALEDERSCLDGRVFLLVDTDKSFEKYTAKESIKQIRVRRLQNVSKDYTTKLVKTSCTANIQPTAIEDVLNPKAFLATLKSFKETNPDVEKILAAPVIAASNASGFSLDWRASERDLLDAFFDAPKIKCEFATRYNRFEGGGNLMWVKEIKDFLRS